MTPSRLLTPATCALALGWAWSCVPEAPPPPRSAPAPAASVAAGHAAAAGQMSANDWLQTFRAQARREPNNGDLLYNLAVLCDRSGAPDDALTWLRRLDAIGWDFPPRDDHFPALRTRPEYRALAASFAAREPHVQGGRVAFTVREPDLIPEGIAHDARTGAFFLSSVAKRKIVRVDAQGRVFDFVPAGTMGLGSVLGLHVDPARRLLWAVSNPRPSRGVHGARALFGFDVDTGDLRHELLPPHSASPEGLLNDVALGPRGELFVTDSDAGAVYVAPGPEGSLGLLLAPGTMSGPNGVAFFEEAGVLLVAHDVGLASVDPRTGAWRDVAKGKGRALGGCDGIALRGRTLFGVQNGLGAPRVVRADLDRTGSKLVSLRVLEASSPLLELPTTGVVAGDAFYVIANSQLKVREPARLRDVSVLALPIDG